MSYDIKAINFFFFCNTMAKRILIEFRNDFFWTYSYLCLLVSIFYAYYLVLFVITRQPTGIYLVCMTDSQCVLNNKS